MDASVIICTYNRSASLRKTLRSVVSMAIPEGVRWEIIVVDNNSTDDTKRAVEEFSGRPAVALRYELEREQGKSFALNRGIAVARGEILGFTDDDVTVDRGWLRAILQAFQEEGVACVGGKILLDWEAPRPSWLGNLLVDQLGYLDLGDKKIRLAAPKVYGANLAVRRVVAQRHGGFDTQAGPVAGKMYSGEDTFFIEKLIRLNEPTIYSPDAVVHHHVPVGHMTKRYFLRRMFDQGESIGIQMGDYEKRNLIGIPYYMYKELFLKMCHVVGSGLSEPSRSFVKKIDLARTLGMMYGRLRFERRVRNASVS